jgi:hypothetical protein
LIETAHSRRFQIGGIQLEIGEQAQFQSESSLTLRYVVHRNDALAIAPTTTTAAVWRGRLRRWTKKEEAEKHAHTDGRPDVQWDVVSLSHSPNSLTRRKAKKNEKTSYYILYIIRPIYNAYKIYERIKYNISRARQEQDFRFGFVWMSNVCVGVDMSGYKREIVKRTNERQKKTNKNMLPLDSGTVHHFDLIHFDFHSYTYNLFILTRPTILLKMRISYIHPFLKYLRNIIEIFVFVTF